MSFRIAINGYGRIGRCFLRALHQSGHRDALSIVAINEPAELESRAYRTRFDSTHGCFPGAVEVRDGQLWIDDARIEVSHAETPGAVDWRALGLDLVIEASGRYRTRPELEAFLDAGCSRLLLAHPGHSADDVDRTVVFGSNEQTLCGEERIVSAASCTTNAVVPILEVLDRTFGIEHALATTLHSVMNDQPLIDGYHHTDLRMTRSAMQSMIPVDTGLARGVARLLPALEGRIVAKSIRVPVPNVSAIDLVVTLERPTRAEEVNRVLREFAAADRFGVVAYSGGPHASVDFNHNSYSVIVDASQTRNSGAHLINLLLWFDNEWAYSCRLLDVAAFWASRLGRGSGPQPLR